MDRVQLTKQEWSSLGGDAADESPFELPIEPQEDAIEAAGVYLQDALNRDETTLLNRSGNDMLFRDGNNITPLTLTQLLATGGNTLHDATFTDQFTIGEDEIEGTVTGLSPTPVKVIGLQIRDDSGDDDLLYASKITAINSDGFDYVIRMLDDETWEQTTALSLTIDYIWSEV